MTKATDTETVRIDEDLHNFTDVTSRRVTLKPGVDVQMSARVTPEGDAAEITLLFHNGKGLEMSVEIDGCIDPRNLPEAVVSTKFLLKEKISDDYADVAGSIVRNLIIRLGSLHFIGDDDGETVEIVLSVGDETVTGVVERGANKAFDFNGNSN